MSIRPTQFGLAATPWKWSIRLVNTANVAVDADSTPTVVVYKDGTATGETVTVTKPAATTGWYQCSFTPATAAEHSVYGFIETAIIGGITQAPHHWHATVVKVMRGTDSAYTGTPPTAVEVRQEMDSNSVGLASIYARQGAPAGASQSADIAAVKADTATLLSRITSTLFSGITYLSRWLGTLAGKTADATTLAEITATTAGAGYDNTTDSLQAIKDAGGGGLTESQAAALTRIDTKTALITGSKLSVAGAVTPGGDITLIIGDDHLEDADSELIRTITDTGGALFSRLDAAAALSFGAGRAGQPNLITGTVVATYAANITTLTIEIDNEAITSGAIASEDYTYQIQRITADGDHVVEVSGNLTLLARYVSRT